MVSFWPVSPAWYWARGGICCSPGRRYSSDALDFVTCSRGWHLTSGWLAFDRRLTRSPLLVRVNLKEQRQIQIDGRFSTPRTTEPIENFKKEVKWKEKRDSDHIVNPTHTSGRHSWAWRMCSTAPFSYTDPWHPGAIGRLWKGVRKSLHSKRTKSQSDTVGLEVQTEVAKQKEAKTQLVHEKTHVYLACFTPGLLCLKDKMDEWKKQ